MEQQEQKTYKGMVVNKYGEQPVLEELTFRELKDHEVLVKIMAISIIPADGFNLLGGYGNVTPPLPAVFGIEGSGIIEKVGSKVDANLVGKHCGIALGPKPKNYHGVWAQYAYATIYDILVFEKKIEFSQIFSSFINPITICGFIDTVKKAGCKSVAQNGASSALGRMMIKLCNREGIEVLSLVRKESTIDELKQIGGKHFITTSDKDWEKQYTDYCKQLDIKILFDCVGGEFTSKFLSAMPNGSTLYHFGNLEKKPITNLSTADFIFKDKTIKGFWLSTWIKTLKPEEFLHWSNVVKKDFEEFNGEIFSTEYKKEFTLENFAEAMKTYKETSGRVLIKPNF